MVEDFQEIFLLGLAVCSDPNVIQKQNADIVNDFRAELATIWIASPLHDMPDVRLKIDPSHNPLLNVSIHSRHRKRFSTTRIAADVQRPRIRVLAFHQSVFQSIWYQIPITRQNAIRKFTHFRRQFLQGH